MNKWSRQKMKEIGKSRMKANYWKAVLVAAILMLFMGTGGAAAGGGRANQTEETTAVQQAVESVDEAVDIGLQETEPGETQIQENSRDDVEKEIIEKSKTLVGIVVFIIFLLIGFAIFFVIKVLIGNPIIIGSARFFYQNLEKNADVKEICYTFDKGYKNGVKVMFFVDLYTFLWTLLFIIPGIIKSYEYYMIPYLLSENENMTKEEAFARSRQMMKGNKWRAFVLDLSFFPWLILSTITLGIAGVFYVNPYVQSTGAAFYQALKEEELFNAMAEE